MPELPEVETVARQLSRCVVGQTVRQLALYDPLLDPDGPERAVGREIRRVVRRGKQVVIELGPPGESGTDLLLCVHLRMTGRLIADGESPAGPDRHLRAVLALDRGSVRFCDPRRFGTIRVMRPEEFDPGPGVEPQDRRFTAKVLAELARGSRQPVKPWLMRQDRIAGIGNIYASEILFAAGISPSREIGSLAPDEFAVLHRQIKIVLRRAVRLCGTTFSDFQDTRGQSGRFGRMLAVYGREGLPCRRCGAAVVRRTQQGRGTFFCPTCQS